MWEAAGRLPRFAGWPACSAAPVGPVPATNCPAGPLLELLFLPAHCAFLWGPVGRAFLSRSHFLPLFLAFLGESYWKKSAAVAESEISETAI